jgi:hypothetical protein
MPPGISKCIRHVAKIHHRRFIPGSGVNKTKYFFGTETKNIQNRKIVGKIKGRVSGVQSPEQAGPHIKITPEALPTLSRAVSPSFHIFFCPTGQTFGMGLMGVNGLDV